MKIDDITDNRFRSGLDKIKIEYKPSMFNEDHPPKNAVPLREVEVELRSMIDNNSLRSRIDRELRVESYSGGKGCDIVLQGDRYSKVQLYTIRDSNALGAANIIRSKLHRILMSIDSKDINNLRQRHQNTVGHFETMRRMLYRMLTELTNKTRLNIVYKCSYLKPGLTY